MTDLFISYKAEDRSRVLPLVAALEDQGISVWWDEHIGGGDDWRETILRHLETARCVIVVWSRRSVGPKGEFVRDEASRAKRQGTYLPVRIDKVDPPLGFGEMQVLDLAGWKGDTAHPRFQAVLAAVRARLGIEILAVGAPIIASNQQKKRGRRRRDRRCGGRRRRRLAVDQALGCESPKHRRSSIRQSERRTEPGLFLRWHCRGAAQRACAHPRPESRCPHFVRSRAQCGYRNRCLETACRERPYRQRPPLGADDPRERAAHRWRDRHRTLVGGVRPPRGDALQIQTDIANMVAQAFSIHLGSAERRALKEGGTGNAEAQDLLLQAQAIVWRNDDAASFARAMDFVDQRIVPRSRIWRRH